MTEYAITFGQWLERWMHAHHLTSASLAAMTGARSATSISRLRRDQCTPKLCQTFLDTLLTLPDGMLSPEEARQFRTALEYTRVQLNRMPEESAYRRIFLTESRRRSSLLLEQIRPLLQNADEVHVLTFQRPNFLLFDDLASLLNAYGNKIRIYCCLILTERLNGLHFLADAMPVLCDPRCRIVQLPPTASSPGEMSILRVREGQVWHEHLLVSQPGKKARVLALPYGSELFDFFWQATDDASPLNTTMTLDTPEDCLSYLEQNYLYEKDAELCIIHADPCVPFVPLDILQEAFRAGIPNEAYQQQLLALRRICYLRFSNLHTKKRATHMILSCSGMERFMATGITTDHFAILRPFTLEERKAIIRSLMEHMKEGRNLTLRLSREERLFSHSFVALCGHGVIINPAATNASIDYISLPVCECALADPSLARSLRNYFCNNILPCHTLSAEESYAFLAGLIDD